MKILSIISLVLMVIGALNWLLVGVFGFNLVTHLFGSMSLISRIIYLLVGLAGIFGIGMLSVLCMSRDECVPGHAHSHI
jgi:uncharacterized protein